MSIYDIIGEKIVVNVQSGDEARIFLDLAKHIGNDDSCTKESMGYEVYNDRTCYELVTRNDVRYCSRGFFERNGYTVVDFCEISELREAIESKQHQGDISESRMSVKDFLGFVM